jgi:starch-binding outer membrane protein, SusD/RagB family
MKNYIKIIALGSALSLGSCSNLLDTEPKQSLTPDTALADVNGYESVLAAAYGGVRRFGTYGQTLMIAPEIMADNLRIIANTGRYIGQEINADRQHMNLWGDFTPTTQANNYGSINQTNIIISGIDAIEGDATRKNRIKGEAFFLRSLYYFDLAKVYGYEPGKEVNGWNNSVVIRTTPTLGFSDADFKARSTNRQVYDLIEADLNTAIGLLPVAAKGTAGIYRVTKGAAEALLARVYLYDSKFPEAAAMASQAMATFGLANDGTGLNTPANYVSGFSTYPNPESLFEVEIRSVDWSTVDGVNNSMCTLTSNVFSSAQFIVTASNELLAAYETGDVRRDTWVATTRSGAAGTVYRSAKWLGTKGDFLENLPIIRAAELYLIRARSDLNALRSKRGLAAVDAGLVGDALFAQILKERRLEFAVEGHRWFDLKRNGLTISKAGNIEAVPYSDYRLLAPLPQDQLILNELLVDNPGYN